MDLVRFGLNIAADATAYGASRAASRGDYHGANRALATANALGYAGTQHVGDNPVRYGLDVAGMSVAENSRMREAEGNHIGAARTADTAASLGYAADRTTSQPRVPGKGLPVRGPYVPPPPLPLPPAPIVPHHSAGGSMYESPNPVPSPQGPWRTTVRRAPIEVPVKETTTTTTTTEWKAV
eukprot:TRINITY_DN56658_c0_g1_i1.p2 TRINITY_DN56658_c0_g1~~TRINITY_DN56658_c0_g1_i1.p2  ORF type:complete len:181 (-),score=6.36 TRINITY_DN56658_c0_g1_i1:219-761(-)